MKEIRVNAFVMNCMGHQSPGLWVHPRDETRRYTDIAYWVDLARTLERGKFDGVFLADIQGIYDVYGGTPDTALTHGVQVPNGDPFVLISAMAHATEHLGFGITGNLSAEPPYLFARRFSTLDHLTKGRVGWNVVTGFLNSAAKGLGRPAQRGHDVRYDIAEEYMALMYKLWEGGWADDALVADAARGVLIDPAKVRKIHHDGEYFTLDAIHLAEPSPQRTPVLYQAGTSVRGRAFAARHAECVFIAAPTIAEVAGWVADMRRRAREFGRDPRELLVFAEISAVVATDAAAAEAKHQEYRRHVNPAAALALVSGWTGVDFSKYGLDDTIAYRQNDSVNSHLESITSTDPGKRWTVRQIAEYIALGGIAPLLVGTPGQIVDEMERWMAEADIDGFNLAYAVYPEGYTEFVDLVVPEMQRRGEYKTDYAPGTLREKLYGAGRARLPAAHPAAGYRFVS